QPAARVGPGGTGDRIVRMKSAMAVLNGQRGTGARPLGRFIARFSIGQAGNAGSWNDTATIPTIFNFQFSILNLQWLLDSSALVTSTILGILGGGTLKRPKGRAPWLWLRRATLLAALLTAAFAHGQPVPK